MENVSIDNPRRFAQDIALPACPPLPGWLLVASVGEYNSTILRPAKADGAEAREAAGTDGNTDGGDGSDASRSEYPIIISRNIC